MKIIMLQKIASKKDRDFTFQIKRQLWWYNAYITDVQQIDTIYYFRLQQWEWVFRSALQLTSFDERLNHIVNSLHLRTSLERIL